MSENTHERGVFAALSEPADTEIAIADAYYPINGVFLNSPLAAFDLVDDPGIQYINHASKWFEIDWHATVKSNMRRTCIHVGIRHNGMIDQRSVMGARTSTRNALVVISGTATVNLKTGDIIQLVVTADKVSVVKFIHFTTTIREFYQ